VSRFFRFPHTPHLAWLGDAKPRDDKVLSESERRDFLKHELIVEEKVDGGNLGLSVSDNGEVRAQNRGGYLTPSSVHPQFKTLFSWVARRRDALVEALYPDLILFGEWCYAVHSIRYTRLPDWFLAFDIYDRRRDGFWSVQERDALVDRLGVARVPELASGHFSLRALQQRLGESRLGAPMAEGLYLRRNDDPGARSKLVRPEFTQAIAEHWSRRAIKTNTRADGAAWY
jgi:ATP-dependent RNA circularization protein (DNA/RNA ligase family)